MSMMLSDLVGLTPDFFKDAYPRFKFRFAVFVPQLRLKRANAIINSDIISECQIQSSKLQSLSVSLTACYWASSPSDGH